MKDSAVKAVCYSAKLVFPGLLRYESGPVLMLSQQSALSCLPFNSATRSNVLALRATLGSWRVSIR